MDSAASSVMLERLHRMSRLVLSFVVIVSAALAAPPVIAQPAAPAPSVAKPVAVTPAAAKSGTATPGTKPAAKPAASKLASSSASKPANKKGAKKPPKNAPVVLLHVNRHDQMALRLRDAQGRPVKGMQRQFNRFLRCHHTNAQHAMNPRLMRLLYQTGKHWPGKRLEVVSGYRHPTVAKNPRSPHMQGLACDFRVEGVQAAELRDYLRRAFEKVGVGYYPNSSFVHLDVRKERSAFWIDYSGPGERAVYSANPNDDLRNGRADKYHPTKIDASWANDGEGEPGPGPGLGLGPAAGKDEPRPPVPGTEPSPEQ
jgi:uncharacterized protein YcbK (DUF882 family)